MSDCVSLVSTRRELNRQMNEIRYQEILSIQGFDVNWEDREIWGALAQHIGMIEADAFRAAIKLLGVATKPMHGFHFPHRSSSFTGTPFKLSSPQTSTGRPNPVTNDSISHASHQSVHGSSSGLTQISPPLNDVGFGDLNTVLDALLDGSSSPWFPFPFPHPHHPSAPAPPAPQSSTSAPLFRGSPAVSATLTALAATACPIGHQVISCVRGDESRAQATGNCIQALGTTVVQNCCVSQTISAAAGSYSTLSTLGVVGFWVVGAGIGHAAFMLINDAIQHYENCRRSGIPCQWSNFLRSRVWESVKRMAIPAAISGGAAAIAHFLGNTVLLSPVLYGAALAVSFVIIAFDNSQTWDERVATCCRSVTATGFSVTGAVVGAIVVPGLGALPGAVIGSVIYACLSCLVDWFWDYDDPLKQLARLLGFRGYHFYHKLVDQNLLANEVDQKFDQVNNEADSIDRELSYRRAKASNGAEQIPQERGDAKHQTMGNNEMKQQIEILNEAMTQLLAFRRLHAMFPTGIPPAQRAELKRVADGIRKLRLSKSPLKLN